MKYSTKDLKEGRILHFIKDNNFAILLPISEKYNTLEIVYSDGSYDYNISHNPFDEIKDKEFDLYESPNPFISFLHLVHWKDISFSEEHTGLKLVHKKHLLKIYPMYFKEILWNKKTFEIRKNDRDYKVGDILVLQEFDAASQEYTGNKLEVEVTYLLQNTDYLQEGYVCMGIKRLNIATK